MTYKEFRAWCNERACDGCWGIREAMICCGILAKINRLPFWKRKKAWNECKDELEELIIAPINQRIKEWRGEQA